LKCEFPQMLIISVAGLLWSKLVQGVSAKADYGLGVVAPTSEEPTDCLNSIHHEYCTGRCILLNVWANMGLQMRYGAIKEMLYEYTLLNLFYMCPFDWFAFKLQALCRQAEDHNQINTRGIEDVLWHIFEAVGFNLTSYFHPMRQPSAVFMHAQKFVQQYESQKERNHQKARRSGNAAIVKIQAAIDGHSDLPSVVPDMMSFDDVLAGMSAPGCSLEGITIGLAHTSHVLKIARERYHGDKKDVNAHVLENKRVNLLLNSAQRCLKSASMGHYLFGSLQAGVPLFGVLDRIDCRNLVVIDNEPALLNTQYVRLRYVGFYAGQRLHSRPFVMHVLPIRDFESNFVRGNRRFHCDQGYKDILVERHCARLANDDFLVAEVGAYLGGCSFWPLMHLPGTRSLAIEPFVESVKAMRRTADFNGIPSDRFQTLEVCVSDEANLVSSLFRDDSSLQPGTKRSAADSIAPLGSVSIGRSEVVEVQHACRTLSDVLVQSSFADTPWDVVRVHTSGLEWPILRSGIQALSRGHVKTLVTMLTTAQSASDLRSIVGLLLEAGAHLTYIDKPVVDPEDLIRLHTEKGIAVPLIADFRDDNQSETSTAFD